MEKVYILCLFVIIASVQGAWAAPQIQDQTDGKPPQSLFMSFLYRVYNNFVRRYSNDSTHTETQSRQLVLSPAEMLLLRQRQQQQAVAIAQAQLHEQLIRNQQDDSSSEEDFDSDEIFGRRPNLQRGILPAIPARVPLFRSAETFDDKDTANTTEVPDRGRKY